MTQNGLDDLNMADIAQSLVVDGRTIVITWMPPPFEPPLELTTQAYGICFTLASEIVLITQNNKSWNLPGGTVEAGETIVETLKREVWEEACATVLESVYIGCQRIDDPDSSTGLTQYYQARFWGRVSLQPFKPEFETVARKLVTPNQFLTTLNWGYAPSASRILEAGLHIEETRNI